MSATISAAAAPLTSRMTVLLRAASAARHSRSVAAASASRSRQFTVPRPRPVLAMNETCPRYYRSAPFRQGGSADGPGHDLLGRAAQRGIERPHDFGERIGCCLGLAAHRHLAGDPALRESDQLCIEPNDDAWRCLGRIVDRFEIADRD